MGCNCSRTALRERNQSPTTTISVENTQELTTKRRRNDEPSECSSQPPRPPAASVVTSAEIADAMARRLAYFDKKCMIKTSLSTESLPMGTRSPSPGRSGYVEHHLMVPWRDTDPDVAANFWLEGPPPVNAASDVNLGWNEVGDGKFADPVGSLTLSNKQYLKISAWRRIPELLVPASGSQRVTVHDDDGRVMSPGEPLKPRITGDQPPRAITIRQGFIGDCSFLSSLAALAEYQLRCGGQVIESLLYPKLNGKPVVNPQGMYGCKLYFNGCYRKVVIDDFIPTKKDGRILSAHTNSRRDLWVTLVEKGFIRLSGGAYYMHGSNPGADLFHLTGWLPETIPFKKELITSGETGSPVYHPPNKWDVVWDNMYRGFVEGRCVICLGTSDVPDSAPSGLEYVEGVSISSGMVARHAYAVLKLVQTTDPHSRSPVPLRLVYVRNPWGVIRWKLDYAPGNGLWTSALERVCEYDSKRAVRSDDGCFWIKWEDIILWFSHVYICWNHNCLPYKQSLTASWGADPQLALSILQDDSHLVAYNPQIKIRVRPVFADTRENYERLLVQRAEDPQVFTTVVWILLSRHLQVKKKDFFQRYIACHIHQIDEASNGNGSSPEHQGGASTTNPWVSEDGDAAMRSICSNPATTLQGIYSNGECVLLRVTVLRSVECDEDLRKEWRELEEASANPEFDHNFEVSTDIPGSNAKPLQGETFVLVVSQFGQKTPFNFSLRVHSTVPVATQELSPLINDREWHTMAITSQWTKSDSGGCSNDLWDYFRNPHFRLAVPKACKVYLILETMDDVSIGLRLFHARFASPRDLRTCSAETSGSYRQGACFIRTRLEAGEYTLIPSTFTSGQRAKFRLVAHVNLSPAEVSDAAQLSEGVRLQPNGEELRSGRLFCPLFLGPIPYPFCREPTMLAHKTASLVSEPLRLLYRVRPLSPVTWLSVRLQIHDRTLDSSLFPSMKLVCAVPNDCESYLPPLESVEACWDCIQRHHSENCEVLRVLSLSDIEGGLSANGKTPSSAASRLYTKYALACLSCATLYRGLTYYLAIGTVLADRLETKTSFSAAANDKAVYTLSVLGPSRDLQIQPL